MEKAFNSIKDYLFIVHDSLNKYALTTFNSIKDYPQLEKNRVQVKMNKLSIPLRIINSE